MTYQEPTQPGTELANPTVIGDICGARDLALERITQAADTLAHAHGLAKEAETLAKTANGGGEFYFGNGSSRDSQVAPLFGTYWKKEDALKDFRETLDRDVWRYLVRRTGIDTLMDKQAKDQLDESLRVNVPEITIENVMATMADLLGDRDLIFKRGLANAFSNLDRRFKSHDGFKIGTRMVLTYVFSEYGSIAYGSRHYNTFIDLERVFAVLDGKKPDSMGLFDAVKESRGGSYGAMQSETVTPYFRIKGFKNGNAHLWFTRDDLVEKANKILADYYGQVIGDAMAKDGAAEDLKHRSGALAKDLQFYATPPEVIKTMLRDLYFKPEHRVLEPSAGVGAITFAVVDKVEAVDAVEVHPGRADAIAARRHPKVRVVCQNFLQMTPHPIYDHVIMNPPFYGTHWMDHIMHAFEFLKEGGSLIAVLPITAEFGETKRHLAFRAWAKDHAFSTWGSMFTDLPQESFASSGTNINTVILKLGK